ncbi:MAG: FGGY-family carbohydrate kinase [Actinomycetota bacterium]|nr:FGGY-family carbohydrate kinase [Actinomycetota bacterium]
MKVRRYIAAVDLGASSGRVSSISFDGERVSFELANRFSNGAISIGNNLYWDLGRLYSGVKAGVASANQIAVDASSSLSSVGVDSWAVDYGFILPNGPLLSLPHHHRDDRTIATQSIFLQRWNPLDLYRRSGIALHRFNTLFQLMAEDRSLFELSSLRALLIPDLLNYFMTNEIATEATNFSTTQLMMASGKIDEVLLGEIGAGKDLFGEIVGEATLRGYLTSQLSSELSVDPLPVHTVASHDTASAVLAVPFSPHFTAEMSSQKLASEPISAYISSGTWSLVGVELDNPILSKEAFEGGYTNELGAFGRYRFLKNVMGLWLLTETLRDLGIGPSGDELGELIQQASWVKPFSSLVDATSEEFLGVGKMARRIFESARRMGFSPPVAPQEYARCIFDSLAISYAESIAELEDLTKRPIDVIHVVGGGSQNRLLSQLTADATGKVVVAGPVEAAALGNGLMQLIALGDLPRDLKVVRSVIADSFEVATFEPDPISHQSFLEQIDRIRAHRSQGPK